MTVRGRLGHLLRSPVHPLSAAGRARRRFNCADQDSPSWEERAHDAAGLWATHRGDWRPPDRHALLVADLGAGSERLRPVLAERLPQPHEYVAYDLLPQQPTTQRLDVVSEVPARTFDLVFCLGLLEYVPLAAQLPARLPAIARFAVVSYVLLDGPERLSVEERESRGWVTHQTRAELEEEWRSAGWWTEGFTLSERRRTGLWLFRAVA